MLSRLRGWIAAHPRWSVAIIIFIAVPVIAYSALIWKTALRPDRLASVSRLVRQFDQVVFQQEPEKAHLVRISKWTSQVPIRISGDHGDRWNEFIERQVETLRELTGVNFLIDWIPRQRGKIFIYFAEPSDYDRIIIKHVRRPGSFLESSKGKTCFSRYTIPFRVIKKSIIIISTERSDYLTAICIFRQLTRVLGFPNVSEMIRPSVFSKWENDLWSLSINDRILVRTLYDKRMQVGMHREEALEVARLIIADLAAEARAKEAQAGD